MSKILKDKPVKEFPIPEGIEFMKIDPRAGPTQKVSSRSKIGTDFFKFDLNLSTKGK